MAETTTLHTIALDVMGGDDAPGIVLEGAQIFCKQNSDCSFLLFGDNEQIAPLLEKHKELKARSKVFHTTATISGSDKPSTALRKSRHSSMGMAINAVKEGQAHAMVSAGNTGALMGIAKFMLRTLPGIERPAIATAMPSKKDTFVMLDLGANVDCDADNLFQFAVMGDAFARVLLKRKHPKIGLLNIGTEQAKGNEVVRTTADMLRSLGNNLNFKGFVEGDTMSEGVVDVVVTDGFSGNIALKTAEGTAKMCMSYLQNAYRQTPLAWLGFIFSIPAFKKMVKKLDPRLHNGAMFLGINGIVIKSHGGTDGKGFANAIKVARRMAENNINMHITQELERFEKALYEAEEQDEVKTKL